jgi:cbb3-type cytochrome oxidase subunit 1
MSEIFDAADREQMEELNRDKQRYTEAIKKLRLLYWIRLAGCVLILIGALLFAAVFVLNHVENQAILKQRLYCEDSWSDWKNYDLNYRTVSF